MKHYKNEDSRMKEFNDAFDFAKKESEKKKQKQLSKAREWKDNLFRDPLNPDNIWDKFRVKTNK